jgi:ribosomal protein S18 acetylase RimI-like enzyme
VSELSIRVGAQNFSARWEAAAPQTRDALRRLLPLRQKLIHCKWSGEGCWIPFGESRLPVGFENHTSHPAPGEVIVYTGNLSEGEILIAYGAVDFSRRRARPRQGPRRAVGHGPARPVGRRAGHRYRGAAVVAHVRPIEPRDRDALADHLRDDWGSTQVATRGRLVDVSQLPGFIARDFGEWLGYITYEMRDGELEVTALSSAGVRRGTGSALLAACVRAAADAGATRVWLITTNDNIAGLRYYQRRGFVLVALRPGAVEEARRTLKPEISLVGADDIPIRDEIELELPRAAWPQFVEKYEWPST